MAKSLLLAESLYLGGEVVRRSKSELQTYAEKIRSGRGIEFNADEVAELVEQKQLLDSMPPWAPWLALLRLFAPGLLFLGGLLLVVLLLRLLLR